MKRILEMFEDTINSIKKSELKKNPEASAKAFELKQMIAELKNQVNCIQTDSSNQGVLQYINPKVLLEN